MKKFVCAVAVMFTVALSAQAAQAGTIKELLAKGGHKDKTLNVTDTVVGGAATGAYFLVRNHGEGFNRPTELTAAGLTTIGCMALSPIIGGIVTQRELTRREVHVMMANCVIPFIGGWLMNAYFDAHPERDSVPPVVEVSAPGPRHKKFKK